MKRIIILFTLIIALTSCDFNTKNNLQDEETKSVDYTKYIKGLSPVDVYLNLEKQGFETSKSFSKEYGNSWTSTNSYAGIDYRVTVFSSNIENVESVTATAIVDVTQKKIIAVQSFIVYVSSLPYDDSNPQEAGNWVIENFNNDKATIVIGDAKFTMYASSTASRMLTIEKAK